MFNIEIDPLKLLNYLKKMRQRTMAFVFRTCRMIEKIQIKSKIQLFRESCSTKYRIAAIRRGSWSMTVYVSVM